MTLKIMHLVKPFLLVIFSFLYSPIFALDVVVDNTNAKRSPSLVQISDKTLSIGAVNSEYGFSHNQFKKLSNKGGEIVIDNTVAPHAPAKVILFEVTGYEVSELKGTIKVEGEKAKLIIVNANGINCDSCNFINAEEVEFRTVNLDAVIDNRMVWKKNGVGSIYIGKDGVFVPDGALAINSRKIKIDGQILAAEWLRVEGGLRGEKSDQYAIDVNIDKPIIARKIYLGAIGLGDSIKIVTPKFFLNKENKKIAALITSTDDICIEAQGRVDITGTFYAGNNLKIASKNINIFNVDADGSLVDLDKYCSNGSCSLDLRDTALGMPQIEAGKSLELDSKKIYLDKGVRLKNGDQFLKITADDITGDGSVNSDGLVSVLSFGNVSFHDIHSQGSVLLGTEGDIVVTAIAANKENDVVLQGRKLNIQSVSGARNLVLNGEVSLENTRLNEVGNLDLVETGCQQDLTINIPTEIKGNFKFKGRNFVNQNHFKADNIILDLSGDFINEARGIIEAPGKLSAISKSFSNYHKISLGKELQVKSGYFVHDQGGQISAGPIDIYLTYARFDGFSLYQESDSILESRFGGVRVIAPLGGVYFGYKKDGDNRNGFKYIGSKLLSHGGPIHIQSKGEVIFHGAQLIGDVIVESKRDIKTNTITGSYKKGTHPVIRQVRKVRTVMKPVTKTRQVYWYTERWPRTVDIPLFGSPGGWGEKVHYKTESYVENEPATEIYLADITVQQADFQKVILEPTFSGSKQFFSNKADLIFQASQAYDVFTNTAANFFVDMSKQHSSLVTNFSTQSRATDKTDVETVF